MGCGSLAYHLARALCNTASLRLRWVVGTSQEKAHAFISEMHLNAQPATLQQRIPAELFLLAVPDDAIEELGKQIAPLQPSATLLHFSGGAPLVLLARHTAHAGVFYPLQTFRPRRPLRWEEIPVFYEATDQQALTAIRHLAVALNVRTLIPMDSDRRLKLHLVAVFVSNFTNHILAVAHQLCLSFGLEWQWLCPIIRETFSRIVENGHPPATWQTGPAVRGDMSTLVRHLQCLEEYPRARLLYYVLSDSIRQFHGSVRDQ